MSDDYRPYDVEWEIIFEGDPCPDLLDQPLRDDEGKVIRLDGDPFAPDIPHEYTAAVYGVMAATPRHTYQVVTEHPWCAAAFFEWVDEEPPPVQYVCAWHANHEGAEDEIDGRFGEYYEDFDWPPPNVLLGARCHNQTTADARIPPLLECPAAGRFVELAPLTGAVDLRRFMPTDCFYNAKCPECGHVARSRDVIDTDYFGEATELPCRECGEHVVWGDTGELSWVIAAGDTGPEAEPCALEWFRDLRDQCMAAGVPLYLQQLGSAPMREMTKEEYVDQHDGYASHPETGELIDPAEAYDIEYGGEGAPYYPLADLDLSDPHGADPSEWPEGLRVREMPEVQP